MRQLAVLQLLFGKPEKKKKKLWLEKFCLTWLTNGTIQKQEQEGTLTELHFCASG